MAFHACDVPVELTHRINTRSPGSSGPALDEAAIGEKTCAFHLVFHLCAPRMNFLGIGACRKECDGSSEQEPGWVGKHWKNPPRLAFNDGRLSPGQSAPEQSATTGGESAHARAGNFPARGQDFQIWRSPLGQGGAFQRGFSRRRAVILRAAGNAAVDLNQVHCPSVIRSMAAVPISRLCGRPMMSAACPKQERQHQQPRCPCDHHPKQKPLIGFHYRAPLIFPMI
jgi:hypothetical protein